MRGTRFIATAVVVLAVLGSMGMSHAEPSGGCTAGPVKPGDTPAGIGVAQFGDPTTGAGYVRVCNNAAVVPAPGKGALTVSADPTHQKGYVEIDGDSNNTSPAPCTTGFDRVTFDANGPHFYDAKTGGWTSRSPERTPDQWLMDVAANCQP